MLIRCPTCASGYDVASELLPEGRILRCAHCRDAWVHSAGASASAVLEEKREDPVIVTEASFFRRLADAAERRAPSPAGRRPSRAPAASLAASLVLVSLVGGGMAAVAGKARVVAAFPPSEALYATIGLPVNLSGLSLGDIRSTIQTGDGPPVLTLDGQITNLRHDATQVPALRIAVRDKSRRELYYWTSPAPKAQLAVGETVLFHSRLSAPPRDGQDLAVSFAEPPAEPRRMAEMLPGDR